MSDPWCDEIESGCSRKIHLLQIQVVYETLKLQ